MRKTPPRAAVASQDTWDLSTLYADRAAWDRDCVRLEKEIVKFRRYSGRFGEGPQAIAGALKLNSKFHQMAERLGAYAYLKAAEDQADSDSQAMLGRYQSLATRAAEASSYIQPEWLSLSEAKAKRILRAPKLARFRLLLERMQRFRPHTLSQSEERLLAIQGEMAQATNKVFRQLVDADLKFGTLRDEEGKPTDLTHATYFQFLHSEKRDVRKSAFDQYYAQFIAHENTLAATLAGSVHRDVYYARARAYPSARDAAIFPDRVPTTVYDQLIKTVRSRLPVLFRYLEVRRQRLKLRALHAYDLDVPLWSGVTRKRNWNQATRAVVESLHFLGGEYQSTLFDGLQGRWCDRYPNQGKQSGAFSYGTYDAPPFILMNYRSDLLDDVFTLAHEAGHAMHSWYSAKNQPFEYYHYTIFVAEVASTFNEQLLNRYLLEQARDDQERAYLLNREIDAIRRTMIRQTMFADYEQRIHAMAEQGEPLTVKSLTGTYAGLLRDYFGASFVIDEALHREGLRIPHFYRAFYVYKYATGMAAAIALAEQVASGSADARQRYLKFLSSGCSQDPLDLLKDAGVDMTTSGPVDVALIRMQQLVSELDDLL